LTEASFSPPNPKGIGYPKNTIYMKYEIVFDKKYHKGFGRFIVRRKDKKEITKGVLGYYFDNKISAEKHLGLLKNKKWFEQNSVEELNS